MYSDREMRTTLQKVILLLLAAMAVVFAVLTAVSRTRERVQYDNMLMTFSREGEKTVYTGEKGGQQVTILCYEEGGAKIVEFIVGNLYHYTGRVEYPDGTITTQYGTQVPRLRIILGSQIIFDGGYNPNANGYGSYFKADGSFEPFFSVSVGYSDPWYDYVPTASNILYFANGPDFVARGSWAAYFVTLLISAIAAADVAFPYALFYFRHHFHVKDPEPTDFYLAMHQIGAVVIAIIVFVLHIIALREIVPL